VTYSFALAAALWIIVSVVAVTRRAESHPQELRRAASCANGATGGSRASLPAERLRAAVRRARREDV